MNVDVPSNDIVGSWDSQVSDNLINSMINIKKDCPENIEVSIYLDLSSI